MTLTVAETGQLVRLHRLRLRRAETALAATRAAVDAADKELERRRKAAQIVHADMVALTAWRHDASDTERARLHDMLEARENLLDRRSAAAAEALERAAAARTEATAAADKAQRAWRIAWAKNEAIGALDRRACAAQRIAAELRQERRVGDEAMLGSAL